ncbi:hypothetical protein [Brucella anthropi]|uniref:deoxynucleotide monophosphate kinase family protein n=1 Tax=Brucella anthropi TaxID=529 RepID=UPI0039883ED4
MSPVIIGLAGPMRSGKTEVASRLVELYGFEREPFSKPLKDMLRVFGLSDEQLEGTLKNTPAAVLGGKTPRHAMQTLGTEWGRGLIHPDLWTRHWAARAQQHVADGFSVVEEGTRFPNEVKAIHELGGYVVYVDRPAELRGVSSEHVSEMGNMQELADFTLYNGGSFDDLYENIDVLMRQIGKKHG